MTRLFLSAATALLLGSAAHATTSAYASDISFTANTVTFTMDGIMDATAPQQDFSFSIVYSGDIINHAAFGAGSTGNTWSGEIFDGKALDTFAGMYGKTLEASGHFYSWVSHTSSLSGATASNNTVTLTMGANYLNAGNSGTISILWGLPHQSGPVTLGEQTFTALAPEASAIPVPASLPMLLAALAGGAAVARRRKA